MGLTSWSTANHLRRLSQVINTYPFLLSIWCYKQDDLAALASAMVVGVSGSSDNLRAALRQGIVGQSHAVLASVRTTTTSSGQSTAASSPDAWYHITGEFIDPETNGRAVLLNGANRGSNATTSDPAASDSLYIGIRPDQTTEPWPSDGGLAEPSVWDCSGMSIANMDSLAAKLAALENPINIRNESAQPWTNKLVAYHPLVNTTDLNDASGNGHNLTMVGTLTNFGSHPTIDPVSGPPATGSLILTGTSSILNRGLITQTMLKGQ